LTYIVGKNILWKSMRPETVWLLHDILLNIRKSAKKLLKTVKPNCLTVGEW